MSLFVDLENRRLTASVGELVRAGGGREIGLSGGGLARLWEGQHHHTRILAQRVAQVDGYEPEQTVHGELTVDDWTVEIHGRADGVQRDATGTALQVEEIKTIHMGRDLFGRVPGGVYEQYQWQLRLYVRFLSADDHPATAILTLVDVLDGRERQEEVSWTTAQVDEWLRVKLAGLRSVAIARREHQLACAGAAEDLPFPHPEPRPGQLPMMEAVAESLDGGRHLLIAAPTGVGKTAAAMHPALRHTLRRGQRLYLLTAKTLQQKMAVETVRAMSVEGAPWRSIQMRAKGRMCCNHEMICHEDACEYAREYPRKTRQTGLVERLLEEHPHLDPDVIYQQAQAANVCPFELSLDLRGHCDVVICDFNYVFDPRIGLTALGGEGELERALLVVDEAHNLVQRTREYYSPALSGEQLQQALVQVGPGRGSRLLAELRDVLLGLQDVIEATVDEVLPVGVDGTGIVEVDDVPLADARRRLDPLIMRYVQFKRDHEQWIADDPVMGVYFSLVHFFRVLGLGGDEFLHLASRTPEGVKLRILCLDASRFAGEVLEAVAGAVGMSATLEPFEFYQDLLGFRRDRTDTLALPSPFPPENCLVQIATSVGTTYRERPKMWDPIARLVADLAPPGRNALALFPSYAFVHEIAERIDAPGHRVEVQRSSRSRREQLWMLDLLREAARGEGDPVLLLAVLGGVFAEGVDYPGEMLSEVIVVSPGLPQVEPERELLRDYFDRSYGRGFEYAFLLPGMRRAVQAAGRLIRSEHDRGVITLVGRRFAQPRYAAFLPHYWTGGDARTLVSKDPAAAVRGFFGLQG